MKIQEPKTIGLCIIDSIIYSKLMHAQCADEPHEHNCVVVWSSQAEEQLTAMCESWLKEQTAGRLIA